MFVVILVVVVVVVCLLVRCYFSFSSIYRYNEIIRCLIERESFYMLPNIN